MPKDFHKLDRIPAEELTAYERWELPVMDGAGAEAQSPSEAAIEELEGVEVQPLTAQDLEEIRQAAWSEGHEEGFQLGQQEGHEQGLKSGHEEGYQQGLEQGLAQGLEEGRRQGEEAKRAEIDASLQRLEQVTLELMEPIRQQRDDAEQALLNLALAVARTVIRREVSLDTSHIAQVVTEAIDSLPRGSDRIKLIVSPQDAPLVRQMVERQQENWTVTESADLLPGGCKVETSVSLVDYTVEKRFQLAVQQMLGRHTSVQSVQGNAELDDDRLEMTDFRRDLLETPSEPSDVHNKPI